MLTIQIKDKDSVVAVINNIFTLQVDDEVNKGGKLKIKFPIEQWMQDTQLKKGYRITVNYGIKIGQIIKLFDGYITDITLKTDEAEIQGENWLSYLQNRILRSQRTYTNQAIKDVVSAVYSELNTTYALPISLGLNDCSTSITRQFDTGTSFYDVLKYCWGAEENLVVRVIDGVLEVSTNTGVVLDGLWEYDVNNTRKTNIASWEWKDSMDDYYTYKQNQSGSVSDSTAIASMGLLFEKYEGEGALALPSGIAVPSLSVSRDTDWWDFNIGDRKHIRLNTGYSWLPLEYLGLIQSRKVDISARDGIKAEIKISDKFRTDTNILDLVLQNLRGKGGVSGGGGGDMSNYYTKAQTEQEINSKLDKVCTAEQYQQEYGGSSDNRIFFITG